MWLTHTHTFTNTLLLALIVASLPLALTCMLAFDEVWILSPAHAIWFPGMVMCTYIAEGSTLSYPTCVILRLRAWSKGGGRIFAHSKRKWWWAWSACTVIFCECSLSTVPLSKSLSVCFSCSLPGLLSNQHEQSRISEKWGCAVGGGCHSHHHCLLPLSLQCPSVISLLFVYVLPRLLLLFLLSKYSFLHASSLNIIFKP